MDHEPFELNKLLRKALKEGNLERYIWLHPRPCRLEALRRCAKKYGLQGPDYWGLVRAVWVDSENIRQHPKLWRSIWESDDPERHFIMTEQERKFRDSLDKEITVWRGIRNLEGVGGLSWTMSLKKAKWFARRFSTPEAPGFLLTGKVRKEHVLAVLNSRTEWEVVSCSVRTIRMRELKYIPP